MPPSVLWRCPRCGHRFVNPNSWHSCGTVSLESRFHDKSPQVRETFDRPIDVLRRHGPVTVIPQKTRIALKAQVRFAHVITRRR